MKNTRKGFTLIELVIVVAIIGILALMIIPNFTTVTDDAKVKTWQSNCKTVQAAIGMYQAGNNGELPKNGSVTERLMGMEAGTAKYLQKDPTNDPQGAKYELKQSEGGLYSTYTQGSDSYLYTSNGGFFKNDEPMGGKASSSR